MPLHRGQRTETAFQPGLPQNARAQWRQRCAAVYSPARDSDAVTVSMVFPSSDSISALPIPTDTAGIG